MWENKTSNEITGITSTNYIMPLTKEQLLKPRYKLYADYPGLGGDMPVGTIFTLSDELAFDKFPVWEYSPYGPEFGTWNRSFENYPHLFKPLQWWEERKPEDMPEYVKVIGHGVIVLGESEGNVFKVDKFSGKKGRLDYVRIELHGSCACSWFLPSDESEYQSFNQNKVK